MRLIAWTKTATGWTGDVRGLKLDILPVPDGWVLDIDGKRSTAKSDSVMDLMRLAGAQFAFMGQN